MAQQLRAVRGMNDLLPARSGVWHRVEATVREVGWAYGYQEIRTPVLEQAALFTQSIGDHTDIVEKEMYTFADAGEQRLALRPEATAAAVRACNQHGLLHNQQQRLWYLGPMFRRERPQQGRYRQFHQFGIEAFGWPGPDIDAEVIRLSARIWRRLGVGGLRLQINTLGSAQTRHDYLDALRGYFAAQREHLDADSIRRLTRNPLRILDSKIPATQDVVADAPDIRDFLSPEADAHFANLGEALRRADIDFEVNPRLVRGLDYYTGAVFEWVTERLGAQNAVCAGGRYDQLVEQRGGRPTPAVGFAMGLERVVELVAADDADHRRADIYVACVAEGDCIAADKALAADEAMAIAAAEELRDAGFRVLSHCGGGKLRRQLQRADASGADAAVIFGLAGKPRTAQVKFLRAEAAQHEPAAHEPAQHEISVDALAAWCRQRIPAIQT